jgi:serine/threonine-protein kinase
LVADRYRIVGLVGAGGMGEVYRAHDLKLDQPVALKFLPEPFARDEGRLRRFLDEVRVARQVSHPNVCRVYDIGEHDGHPYISMEYVDGEDLESLLRRIGRLSEDKALEIARQIGAGLAAAHAKGIVHRDIKPSNVMIDGNGQARITDFGLAALAAGLGETEIRLGTPAYMSPEQIDGTEVTARSDIYSLGLVLYELFTGKPAFKAATMAELTQQRLESRPSTPSTLVSGLDPRIERVILSCLERDPTRRPRSALAVVGALPGGDPLSAALAAGETPSPEMVAEAGQNEGLRPGLAVALLALVVVGVGGLLALAPGFQLIHRFELPMPPAALEVRARQLIGALGYENTAADSTFGIGIEDGYEQFVRREDQSNDRWADIGRVRPSSIVFWYRQSPRPLVPLRASGSASYGNPPMWISGMVRVTTDPAGRLLAFDAVPPERAAAADEPYDWQPLLDAAGFESAGLEPAEPLWNPLADCDHRAAWTGAYADQPELPMRIEAGSFGGRPVYFRIVAPWTTPSRMEQETGGQTHVADILALSLISLVLFCGVLMARSHIRRGRGDVRGAFVMAGYLFCVLLAQWLLETHHVRSLSELGLLVDALSSGLLVGAIAWVIYVALEPYARRQWPHALITWTRLLSGRIRDPLVGRDLLIGSLSGVVVALLIVLGHQLPQWTGLVPRAPLSSSVFTLAGLDRVAGILLGTQPGAMIAPIGVFFLIFGLRILVRRQWIALGLAFALMSLLQGLQTQQTTVLGWVTSAAVWGLLIFVIVRLGILAAVISFVYANLLLALPLTTDLSSWYANRAWFGLAVLAAVTAYGFYLSLAGRPLLAGALLQDA